MRLLFRAPDSLKSSLLPRPQGAAESFMKGILTPLLDLPAVTACLGKKRGLEQISPEVLPKFLSAPSAGRSAGGAESEPGLGSSRRVFCAGSSAPPEQEEPGVSGRWGTTVLPLVCKLIAGSFAPLSAAPRWRFGLAPRSGRPWCSGRSYVRRVPIIVGAFHVLLSGGGEGWSCPPGTAAAAQSSSVSLGGETAELLLHLFSFTDSPAVSR